MKSGKITAFLLVLCLILNIFSSVNVFAEEELCMSDAEIIQRMDELYDLLGNKYFNTTLGTACGLKHKNHSCEYCLTNNIVQSDWFIEAFGTGITVSLFPRTYTYSGYFGGAAYSCAGFAAFAEWYIFRQSRTAKVETVRIGRYMYTAENVRENVLIGDLIRMNGVGHSFIVYDYDDNGVTVLDSNWGAEYNCLVQKHVISFGPYSGNSFTISRVPHKNDHSLTVRFSASGGSIDSELTGDTYRVASSTGLNMRTGPGLSYSIVKLLPYGKTFDTYYKDAPVSSDGYTWVRSVVDGDDGWLAVSKSSLAELVSHIRTSDYYTSNDLIYTAAGDGELRLVLEYGTDYETGLPDAASLGLYKDGYVFVGWCAESGGDTPLDPGQTISAGDIIGPEQTGVTFVTLYAVWRSAAGDLNSDGSVDGKDLIRLRKLLNAMQSGGSFDAVPGSDVNGDGVTDGRDLIKLRKYLAGYSDDTGLSDFPIGPD